MMDKFDFSVVIPTHNRKDFLVRAIESVVEQDESIQIIVVDDASSDETKETMEMLVQEHPNITYLRNEVSLFAHGSRRRGYQHVQGKYVIFMDDDDFYTDPAFFRSAKAVLDAQKNVSAVIGRTFVLKDGKHIPGPKFCGPGLVPNREYFNGFLEKHRKPNSSLSAIFRKTALDASKMDQSLMFDDTCIYLNGLLHGDVYLIDEEVAAYCVHTTNISLRSLPKEFILNSMNEKLRMYKAAQELQILDHPRDWAYRQFMDTAMCALESSGKDIRLIPMYLFWWLRNGQGTQFRFIGWIIRKIFRMK